MKRVIFSIAGTVAGVAALLQFKTSQDGSTPLVLAPPAGQSSTASGSTADGTGAEPGTASNAEPSTAPTSAASTSPATASSEPPSSEPSSPANTAPATTAPASSSSANTSKTVLGSTEQIRGGDYGTLQVQVTETNGKITDIQFAKFSANDRRSQFINSQAAPYLVQETLSAQSANISGVSGATYTSQSYVDSLQSALDKL